MVNGHNLMNQRDHHMGNMMDARVNRQFLEQPQMSRFTRWSSWSSSNDVLFFPDQLGNKFDNLPPHHMLGQQTQQKPPNRMPVFPQMSSSSADDDLGMLHHCPKENHTSNNCHLYFPGFDPFIETQKGLAELIENEHLTPSSTSVPSSSSSGSNNSGHSTQRPRMPPPGFNHIPPSSGLNNGFGPRQPPHFQQAHQQPPQQSSKMLSFMNNQQPNNGQNFGNGWNLPPNFGFGMFPQQQQQQMPPQMSAEQQIHMGLLGQNQNGGNLKSGEFCILSFWGTARRTFKKIPMIHETFFAVSRITSICSTSTTTTSHW